MQRCRLESCVRIRDIITLSGLSRPQAQHVVASVAPNRDPRLTLSHTRRVLLVLVWLRTNLTQRGLAAIFGVSQATVHRTITAVLPTVAALHPNRIPDDPAHLFLDGTLIPVHDQTRAAKSKNYRRSINTQIACDHRRRIVFIGRAFPGNRNDIVVARATVPTGRRFVTDGAYRTFPGATTPPPKTQPRQRRRHIRVRARAEHTIARFKDWATMRWLRYRGDTIDHALQAVAYLHNLRMGHINPQK